MIKMYSVVLRHLSQIQKGIQALHAVAEYSLVDPKKFKDWVVNHKTMVILEVNSQDEMEDVIESLEGYKFSEFYEPDIEARTAVAFTEFRWFRLQTK